MVQASRVADDTVFLFEGKAAQSIYENIFSGSIERDERGLTCAVIQRRLRLRVQTEKSDRSRISIDPSGVKIALKGSSAENTFKGRLVQVTDERRRVRLLVDVGLPLSVLIDKDVFRRLQLEMGGDLWITCPVEAIEVI